MVRGQVFRLVGLRVGVRFPGLWALVGLRMVEGFECWKHYITGERVPKASGAVR